jgi:CRP-like cAMP-binding protein
LQSVATALRHVQYTAGETVFRQGDEGDGCYVVVKGQVKGQIEHAGVAAPTRFDLGRGAVLGEMSLMTGLPRTATITVTEEVELLEIPAAAFTQLLGLRPEIPEILARLAAERAAANAASLEELKTRTSVDVNATVRRESILKRFLSMLGGRTDKGEKKA